MELRVNVRKSHGDFRFEADLAVSGSRVGLFGPSGSGKSTFVSLLAGSLKPDRGEIYLGGECLFSSDRKINIPAERRRIGMVFQESCLFPHLDVTANLRYGFKRCKTEHRKVDFDTLVDALNLDGLLGRRVSNLSGGEKQRVALGRTVLANPRLLLMDEPLTALDDTLRFQIIPYLKDVGERFDIPYLFITHSLLEMRLMADRVLVVSNGRVVEETTAEALARSRMGASQVGYINLIKVGEPRLEGGLRAYRWGGGELLISGGEREGELFELSSRDIILFKKHPDAISARNLLACTVAGTFVSGNRVGVELESDGERLVAEVVPQAAAELGIEPGMELYAAMKASAFRRVG